MQEREGIFNKFNLLIGYVIVKGPSIEVRNTQRWRTGSAKSVRFIINYRLFPSRDGSKNDFSLHMFHGHLFDTLNIPYIIVELLLRPKPK